MPVIRTARARPHRFTVAHALGSLFGALAVFAVQIGLSWGEGQHRVRRHFGETPRISVALAKAPESSRPLPLESAGLLALDVDYDVLLRIDQTGRVLLAMETTTGTTLGMEARLRAPAFKVDEARPEFGPRWSWFVVPLSTGSHQMALDVNSTTEHKGCSIAMPVEVVNEFGLRSTTTSVLKAIVLAVGFLGVLVPLGQKLKVLPGRAE